ncbi:RadC family protein [Alcaligenes phenolicus]|uniref:DNA repair protein RadC n=1 Tax=Alcaligenes phenolicus TaxID=232846 RepID=A0AAW5VX34_9BURK|nr:DNA repair protein RadC [Alcaligenes phenolicus]MCX5565812.1 DNA repair protein RadC [Alcaligenes phenolicus]
MSEQSFSSFESALLVRDAQGRYLPATTDQILEAARYAVDLKMTRGMAFTSPMVVKEYLTAKLAGFDVEVFAVLFLDSQHRLIEYVEMFQGTLNQASVYPREVAKAALHRHAAAVIISHNHPSGNPEPSEADKALTAHLRKALALLDVRILDHVIVAGQDTTSFAEQGLL